ncbi:MAG: DNA-methyltransferase [Actinomycetota bacterium]
MKDSAVPQAMQEKRFGTSGERRSCSARVERRITDALVARSSWYVERGDALTVLQALPEAWIDACVTDPPYGLEFMGQEWDRFSLAPRNASGPQTPTWHDSGGRTPYACRATPRPFGKRLGQKMAAMRAFAEWSEAWAREVYRVLKPGAHLLAFGGPRTYHRLACAVEEAGFEIRDQVMWIYGQGFPKSRNLGNGWGTALKPAHEPIVVARKPLSERTVAANRSRWGTGGLNIDGSRIAFSGATDESEAKGKNAHGRYGTKHGGNRVYGDYSMLGTRSDWSPEGRWPANVALDPEAATMLDRQSEHLVLGDHTRMHVRDRSTDTQPMKQQDHPATCDGVSRFFYCAKADRAEREIGKPSGASRRMLRWSSGEQSPGTFQSEGTDRYVWNHHPTVKPVKLMRWLVRLVTPPDGVVLDPFAGSGTTGIAAISEGMRFLGIERERDYVQIARRRIRHALRANSSRSNIGASPA